MLSSTLNRASRSRRARRAVEGFPLTRRVVSRFVAGEDVDDAVVTTTALTDLGRRVTVDVLGEDVDDLSAARATAETYRAFLTALRESGNGESVDLSLKLTALGQALPGSGTDVCLDHAREICAAAAAAGCTVTLDMEDHTTVDSTLLVGEKLRVDFPFVGNVLQSNLLRTPGDLAALAGSGARVRLVKGAYREPASVAHQRKADVDLAFGRDLDVLMASDCYPMIATHDPIMLARAARRAAEHARPADAWEAQMLLGVRTDLQDDAIRAGQQLRVYVPFGSDWYGYFMRRLAERPANVAFFLRALARG